VLGRGGTQGKDMFRQRLRCAPARKVGAQDGFASVTFPGNDQKPPTAPVALRFDKPGQRCIGFFLRQTVKIKPCLNFDVSLPYLALGAFV